MRKPRLLVTAALLLIAGLWAMKVVQQPPRPQFAPAISDISSPPPARPDTRDPLPSFLPAQARAMIPVIQRGGPFAHRQDGSVFGNREHRLPQRPRGYYREYTVDTPGLGHRGARRIITGGEPPDVWFYSDDHYESFRSFDVPADGSRP
ncbi:ribonuclease domain-containing protein [Stenotrophomonas sp. YIM B06876]|uniref:ribonuclease domain-containing protein n=1 Tax=Stenotrophomonas sp. YIM B06876 TaxID=3060211 RepID=UPI00273A1196|nr:ribonuclease domain-containing protein [Stenotrophomonas sp. YIM B06876]